MSSEERKSLEDEYTLLSHVQYKRELEEKKKQKEAAKKSTKKLAIDLKSKLKIGKLNIVNPANHRNDFYCSTCDVLKHDSSSYQSHIISKAHMKNIGQKLTIEKSSLIQVKNRLNGLTATATSSPKKPPLFTKKSRTSKKQKSKEVEEEKPLSEEQAQMMELMGFTDFGHTA